MNYANDMFNLLSLTHHTGETLREYGVRLRVRMDACPFNISTVSVLSHGGTTLIRTARTHAHSIPSRTISTSVLYRRGIISTPLLGSAYVRLIPP